MVIFSKEYILNMAENYIKYKDSTNTVEYFAKEELFYILIY